MTSKAWEKEIIVYITQKLQFHIYRLFYTLVSQPQFTLCPYSLPQHETEASGTHDTR